MGLLQRLSREEPAPPWGLVTALGTAVGAFAAIILGTSLASAVLGDQPSTFVVGWSIAMAGMALFITVTRNRTPQDGAALRTGSTRSPLPLVLLFSVGVAITFDLIGLIVTGVALPVAQLLRYFNITASPIQALDVGLTGWLLALLFLAVFQPVGEGLVFRGVLFPALRTALGAWGGLLFTAVFHAVFHLLAYAPAGGGASFALTWYSLLLPFLNGLYLAGVRAYTGSTRAAIIAHAGLGAFAVLRALFFAG